MGAHWNSLSPLNKVKFVFSLIMGAIGVVFIMLNWNEQNVHLLYTQIRVPVSVIIFFSIAIGYAWSYLMHIRIERRKDFQIQELEKKIKEFYTQNSDK